MKERRRDRERVKERVGGLHFNLRKNIHVLMLRIK